MRTYPVFAMHEGAKSTAVMLVARPGEEMLKSRASATMCLARLQPGGLRRMASPAWRNLSGARCNMAKNHGVCMRLEALCKAKGSAANEAELQH